jgi:hypothetical protein
MRPDLIFKEYLPVGLVNNIPVNTLLIPIHHKYDFWWTKIFGPTDMFAVGDSKTMSIYSNCWLNLEKLEVDTCPGEKIIFNHYMDDIPNIRTFKYNLVLYSMRFKWDIWSISNIIKTKVIGKKEFWYPSSLQKCVKNNRLSEIKIKFLDI